MSHEGGPMHAQFLIQIRNRTQTQSFAGFFKRYVVNRTLEMTESTSFE